MRDKQPILAVLGVLVLVVGFVWLANVITAPKPITPDASATATPSDDPSATASSTATPTPTPTPTPSALAGCTKVPPIPTTQQRMSTAPDVEAARGKTFVATITTNCGVITVELDGTKAPGAVASFVMLARANYWNDTTCHRLTTQGIFVLQCGDPTGTGGGPGPGYHFGVENAPADGNYPAGTLAMARASDPNSNGDQFFIVHGDTKLPVETGGYTIFGKVTAGLDLVKKIAAAGSYPEGDGAPLGAISILSVSVQPKA